MRVAVSLYWVLFCTAVALPIVIPGDENGLRAQADVRRHNLVRRGLPAIVTEEEKRAAKAAAKAQKTAAKTAISAASLDDPAHMNDLINAGLDHASASANVKSHIKDSPTVVAPTPEQVAYAKKNTIPMYKAGKKMARERTKKYKSMGK